MYENNPDEPDDSDPDDEHDDSILGWMSVDDDRLVHWCWNEGGPGNVGVECRR